MKMTNKIIALFLSAVLLMSLAGCGPSAPEGEAGNQSQTSPQEDPASGPEGQTPEADILSRFYKAQVIREILAHHENVSENVTYYNSQGDVMVSVYQYADSKTVVREGSNSYVDMSSPAAQTASCTCCWRKAMTNYIRMRPVRRSGSTPMKQRKRPYTR